MAQLNSRGTLTRSRWDFFESSDGWAMVRGSVVSGPISAYFTNNSTGATALDIFNITWSATISEVTAVVIIPPPLTIVPITPAETNIFPVLPISATPPGVLGMYSTSTGPFYTVVRYSGGSTGDKLAPVMGSYFLTLLPGWTLAVGNVGSSNPCELTMTIWYQEVLDNIAPAR